MKDHHRQTGSKENRADAKDIQGQGDSKTGQKADRNRGQQVQAHRKAGTGDNTGKAKDRQGQGSMTGRYRYHAQIV